MHLKSTAITVTCLKSAIETLEEGVKYVQDWQLKHQNNVNDVVLVFLLLTLNILHTFFLMFQMLLWTSNINWTANVSIFIKDFVSKCEKICQKLWSFLRLLQKLKTLLCVKKTFKTTAAITTTEEQMIYTTSMLKNMNPKCKAKCTVTNKEKYLKS